MRKTTTTVAALAAFLTLGAMAAGPIPDGDCATCHADASMAAEKHEDGLRFWAAGGREGLTLQVTGDSLKGSIHEGMACVDCHEGITELPHAEKLPRVACSCHDLSAEIGAGMHAAKGAQAGSVPSCVNCHGAHQILPKSDPKSPSNQANVATTCGACHGDTAKMAQLGVRVSNPLKNYEKSDHGMAAAAGTEKKVATCASCHGAHKVLSATDPSSPVARKNIPATCGQCHGAIQAEYAKSIHGTALAAGYAGPPSCADCHGAHDIESKERPTSRVYPPTVSESTCAPCHASLRMSDRFSLPTDRVASYQGSFHGLASTYGKTNVANCASCHGVHNILPSTDPASTIHPANLSGTCGKCHPGAGEAFSKMSIHENVEVSQNPILDWIRWFYITIIAATLGGMALHQLLDYIKRYRDTIRALKPLLVYERMTKGERIQHVSLLVTFFLLVITGFALKYPYSFWGWPFRVIPGGFDARSLIHRIAGVLMIADSLYHVYYLLFTARGRQLGKDMIPKVKDVRDAVAQVLWFFDRKPHEARFGRFSYAEKAEYLALVWGTIVMVATGLVLWFKGWAAQFMPTWGYAAAEMVHFYEAVLAFSAIVIWHLYAVFFKTDRPPFNPTWITGGMTKHSMEHEHPEELEALEAAERAAKKAEGEKDA